MAFELEREVNEHFSPFYGYVAEEMLAAWGGSEGRALEIGPYGPGVAVEMARRRPAMRLVCGDASPEGRAWLRERVAASGLSDRFEVVPLAVDALPFGAGAFDLVVFRGGLFFWDGQARIVGEMDRVLRPGGLGAHGGGFGAGAPEALIEKLLPRARELNDRLGKRRLSRREVEALAEEAGVAGRARVSTGHGLWLLWRKGPG